MREKGKRTSPYYGFEDSQGTPILTVPAIIKGHIELTSCSQICSSPILILNFILDGVNPSGSPACIMRDVLEPYVAGRNLQYHEVFFDIGTLEKAERHTKLMKALMNKVKDISFERIEVFVHTHSETIRGDLWGGGINGYLKGANLWMLACGQTVQVLDAFAALKARVKYHELEHIVAFNAARFHASLISAFVLAYAERVLIEGFEVQDTVPDLLAVSTQLAMHASVIHIHLTSAFRRRPITIVEYTKPVTHVDELSMTVTTYTFFDENRRPWGNTLPYQCSSCKSEIILFTQGYQKSNSVGGISTKGFNAVFLSKWFMQNAIWTQTIMTWLFTKSVMARRSCPPIPTQNNDKTNVLFHQSAADIMPAGKSKNENVYQSVRKKSTKDYDNLQWMQPLPHPLSTYNKNYVVPTVLDMDYTRETNTSAKPTDSTPASSLAQTSNKKSHERKPPIYLGMQPLFFSVKSKALSALVVFPPNPPNWVSSTFGQKRHGRECFMTEDNQSSP
ncbi:hypothetical protein BDR07DRAFT_1383153 [Suillus spraguei]|nr:hypothetical protein BDR07DRAFT_1383153 [Suillus spraguei]